MSHRVFGRRAALCASAAIAVLAGELVVAAEAFAADAAPADSSSPATVEEVVVTARRRVETIQTVADSIAVVGGAQIQSQAIMGVQDLSATLPAVTLSKGSTTDRQFIRGIGSGDNPSFEQSVGVFVDDAYHGRARTSEADLFDVDRVEVLKGPQSTYFGNNAIGGALNIVTKDPDRTFGGDLRALYNPTFGDYLVEGAVSLPVNDTLRLRLAAQASGGDGWIDDIGTHQKIPSTQDAAARAVLVWQPDDNFTARFKIQAARDREEGGLPITRTNCPPAFGAPSGFCALAIASNSQPLSSLTERNSSPGQKTDVDSQDYEATLSWKTSVATITSTTAWSHYDYALNLDLDTLPAPYFSIAAPENYGQFSQELRAASPTGGTIEWLAGLYYQHSDLKVTDDFDYNFLGSKIMAAPPFAALVPYLPFAQAVNFQEKAESESAFGALTWNATSALKITGALRYTTVHKDFTQDIYFGTSEGNYGPVTPFPTAVAGLGQAFATAGGLGKAGIINLERTDQHLSPSVSAQYQFNPQIMAYVEYDNGFKAGGFNGVDTTGNAAELPFAPEKVNSYEAGLKMLLAQDTVRFNVDVYRAEYSSLQLAGIVPSVGGAYVNRVQNAGGAVTQGLELESEWRISSNWRTGLSGTLMDAEYTSYPNATPTAQQTAAGLKNQDLSGRPLSFAPRASGNWMVEFSTPVASNLNFSLTNRLFVTTKYYLGFSDDDFVKQGGYARDDLTATLASDKGWELSLIGKNINNAVIRNFGAALPTSLGSFVFMTEQPASVAIQARYRF